MTLSLRSPAYPGFGLTLVVNHACNLRCSYCYTGAKFQSAMPVEIGDQAIHRALVSIEHGGTLHLGFFGGEPLIESRRILGWIRTARSAAHSQGKTARFNLTTNGTLADADALRVLAQPDLDLAVSCDGTAARHDKHRRDVHGHGTHAQVASFLRRLVADQRPFSVVLVVRPDTVEDLPAGLRHLRELGVTRFTLSLDLWTAWTAPDLDALSRSVETVAGLWREWLPAVSIDWFDTRIAALAGLAPAGPDTRCGFGEGEIAVAPSGRLYPCERLVGADAPDHPLRLAGLVGDGEDFLGVRAPCVAGDSPEHCAKHGSCRCGSFIRTGSTTGADALLPALDRAVHRALERLLAAHPSPSGDQPHE